MGGKYKELDLAEVSLFYSRSDIIEQILANCQYKEVVASFGGTGYAKRPDVIEYESDIKELVKRGATSFHASEELWKDPLSVGTSVPKKETDANRKGWDLLLDIDCAHLPYSQIAADLLIRAIKVNGINAVSCKFSGNHGFHIAVPFEAFPNMFNDTETRLLFPEAPRKIATYLAQMIREQLKKRLLEESLDVIAENLGEEVDSLITNGELDPFKVLEIDTILLTSRHLYRQVYSLNEKSGLVSLPINPDKVLAFDKKIAKMQSCPISRFKFLDRTVVEKNEGLNLLTKAYDADAVNQKRTEKKKKEIKQVFEDSLEPIPHECFPPEIEEMFGPLHDGKKRALFILQQFLRCCRYSVDEIEEKLLAWNKNHQEPLRDSYITGQFKHFRSESRQILPPNFDNPIYADILRHPVSEESLRFKNPFVYAESQFQKNTSSKGKINVYAGLAIGNENDFLLIDNEFPVKKVRKDDNPKEVAELLLKELKLEGDINFVSTYQYSTEDKRFKVFLFSIQKEDISYTDITLTEQSQLIELYKKTR